MAVVLAHTEAGAQLAIQPSDGQDLDSWLRNAIQQDSLMPEDQHRSNSAL